APRGECPRPGGILVAALLVAVLRLAVEQEQELGLGVRRVPGGKEWPDREAEQEGAAQGKESRQWPHDEPGLPQHAHRPQAGDGRLLEGSRERLRAPKGRKLLWTQRIVVFGHACSSDGASASSLRRARRARDSWLLDVPGAMSRARAISSWV